MDKKKAVKLEQMEAEMARLWEQSQNETDNKKKQKLIQSRNKLQWKAAAMRSGRKLSKQTRDDLVAYSFIAPNFIGFAVFTLIPITGSKSVIPYCFTNAVSVSVMPHATPFFS